MGLAVLKRSGRAIECWVVVLTPEEDLASLGLLDRAWNTGCVNDPPVLLRSRAQARQLARRIVAAGWDGARVEKVRVTIEAVSA